MTKSQKDTLEAQSDDYQTPTEAQVNDLADQYGRTMPRYIILDKGTAAEVTDGVTTWQQLYAGNKTMTYHSAVCNPAFNHALFKADATTGVLTLIMTNFEDDRNA